MNLTDLARMVTESKEDASYVVEQVSNILPQKKTRLTENLIALDKHLDRDQKKEMKLAIALIDNSVAFKAIKDAEVEPVVEK